jgi:hypothetical protein
MKLQSAQHVKAKNAVFQTELDCHFVMHQDALDGHQGKCFLQPKIVRPASPKVVQSRGTVFSLSDLFLLITLPVNDKSASLYIIALTGIGQGWPRSFSSHQSHTPNCLLATTTI